MVKTAVLEHFDGEKTKPIFQSEGGQQRTEDRWLCEACHPNGLKKSFFQTFWRFESCLKTFYMIYSCMGKLPVKCSKSQRSDSNRQPLVYKTRALPLSYVGIIASKSAVKHDFRAALIYILSSLIARKLRTNCRKLPEQAEYLCSCPGGGKPIE